jgi:Tfp pilus assembly protein PilZ
MTTKEKREHARRIVAIPIQFIVQGRLYQGQIKNMGKEGWVKNIKKGGVFIETEMSFSVGHVVSMTYSSPHFGEKNRIGTIIRVEPQGIGVKFGHWG